MKTSSLTILILLITIIFSNNSFAQRRIQNNYFNDEPHTLLHQTRTLPAPLPLSLSGYYFEGFEGAFPPAGWQIVDVLDTVATWQMSNTADFPAAYEGSLSAYCRYSYPVGPGEDWLITPKFTVATGDSLSFRFKLEYVGYAPDSTFILVSTTDSSVSSFTTSLDLFYEGLNYPSDTATWVYKTYSLNPFAGQDIFIAFKNANSNGDGIFIDNVEIGTRPAAEVGVLSIDMTDFYPAGNSNPKATVKNNGGSNQTFNVTMNISGGYTSTKQITLSPQSSVQVNFDPWIATIGTFNIDVQTFLAGDVNSANDTLSSTIKVLEPFTNYGWNSHDALVFPNVGGSAVSICSNTNSRIFLIGGINGGYITEGYQYDLSFGTWAGITPMPVISGYAASAFANNKIFVFSGGFDFNTGNPDPNGTTKIYDYNNDTWTTGAPMPLSVANSAFGTYKDSLVYIIGGNSGNGTSTNLVQIYDTYTDTWSNGTPIPGDAIFGNRGGIAGNKIVSCGGYSNNLGSRVGTTYVGEIDTLNPSQISWTQVADYPTGILSRAGSSASLDPNSGLIIFSGGVNSNGPATSARTFAYDVNSNSWKLGPNKITSTELFYMTPVISNDSLYLAALGGGDGTNLTDKNEWLNLGYYQTPTGISELPDNVSLEIMPNPVSDKANILVELDNASPLKIIVLDVLGNTVLNVCDKKDAEGKLQFQVDMKSLAKGIYFCVVATNGSNVTRKLIKE